MPDPILKTSAAQAAARFERAGSALAARQIAEGSARGNVSPWRGAEDADFHGTLAAIWIWGRHQALTGDPRFAAARALGWSFVEQAWRQFIPDAITPEGGDEAAFDCALALRAFCAERALAGEAVPPETMERRAALVDGAAGALADHLGGLQELSGRSFQDPAFLAWNLIEYARAVDGRPLLVLGQRFVERAFGTKAPPPFADEPDGDAGLFDFSSTNATRVLAILASEGNTPFVGAWLRERVASVIPTGFVSRTLDENCWNACVAACTGRAYVVSTDPRFLDAYLTVSAELERRELAGDGTLGPTAREAGGGSEEGGHAAVGAKAGSRRAHPHTLATFYSALAADALVRTDHAPIGAPSPGRPSPLPEVAARAR